MARRRQQASARTGAARQTVVRRRRRRVLAGTAGAIVVAGATWGLLTVADRADGPPSPALHAALVKDALGPLAVSSVPNAYHAVYRAESYSGSKVTVSTEDVSVQRPFDGRVTIREGPTPAGAVQFEGRSSLGSYANYSGSQAGQVSGDAPSVAFGDVRLGSSIGDLAAKGLFVLEERRHTLGRDCQVYRTGSPLQSLKITPPTATDYADACLDESGLVLEEVTVVGGKMTQRLTATEVVADPSFEPGSFAIQGDPVGFDQGGSVLTPLDAAAPGIAGQWQFDAPPAGFEHTGRYTLQTGDKVDPAANPPVAAQVDLYVRGVDIVVLRQGPLGGEPDLSSAASTGDPVDVGGLGTGQLMLSTIGPTIVAHPGGDRFVELSGTLPPAELGSLMASLHQAA